MVQSGTFDVNKYLYPSEHEITTPLVLASKVGLIDTVRVILDAGARLNTQDGSGETACIAAVRALATDVVELLVERGADLSIADSNDCTALSYVSGPMFVDDRAAVALIGAGAPLEDVDALCRIASLSGRVCQMLLDRNVNVAQLRDGFEATPCHAACDRGERAVRDSPEILDFLANVAKVDINVADTNGLTCLHRCATVGASRMLRWLINAGMDVNATTHTGMTPVFMACIDAHYKLVPFLVAAGADVNIRDAKGRSARQFAADALAVDVPRKRQMLDALFCVLAAPAPTDFEPADGKPVSSSARTPAAEEIEAARRSIAKIQLNFVRDRAFEVCVGLCPLQLDALQTCKILVNACGPVAPLIAFHHWWKIATTVKHFLD